MSRPGSIWHGLPRVEDEEHDIVDEYRLFVHPLVLGAGKRLFRQTPRPIPLRLTGCTPTTTGVLLLSYQPEPRGSR